MEKTKNETIEPELKTAFQLMQEQEQAEYNLNKHQFTGTLGYHPSTFGRLNLTDGVDYVRKKYNCYWFSDIIESTQHLPKIKQNTEFIVWRLEVNPNKSFKVSAWTDLPYDPGSSLLYEQLGEYTDFPLKSIDIFQEGKVLLLPSEH